MFRRVVKAWQFRQHCKKKQSDGQDAQEQQSGITPVSKCLCKNLKFLQQVLGNSGDVIIHTFSFGSNNQLQGALVFIDGLVDTKTITQSILMPLLAYRFTGSDGKPGSVEELSRAVLCAGDVTTQSDMDQLVGSCLSGDTMLLTDGFSSGLIISTKGYDKRSVTEPQSETVVRGPREGFTEDFRTNTSLLRRRIKCPDFRLDHMVIGHKSNTNVCVAYIEGVADPKIVSTVKKRLQSIVIDSVVDSGYLEQYIEDAPFSIFPTVGYSEKPDVVAGRIFEGHIAIISDGSPFVLTAPMLFIESFQTSEDYYIRTIYASLIRILRFFAFTITVFAPALFIALTTFHQELIPTTLLYTIADAREGTPFPAFFEALILVFAFDLLREAGVRLPRPIGQAISIVGALVMGEAAVSAGMVGAPMVIIVAITAVSGFVIPRQNEPASILRYIAMVFSALLGGYGIAMVFLALLIHLAKLQSFGIPYYETVNANRDLQDSYIRLPLWQMAKRPLHMARGDINRREGINPLNEKQGGRT